MGRVKVQNSDGGKTAEGFAHENNDCTVRALANSTGLSYKASHEIARKAGRRNGSGMTTEKLRKMMGLLQNYTVTEVTVPAPTVVPGVRFLRRSLRRTKRLGGISVNEFLWRLPKQGAFYLCCTTHAFAVVDGVLRDPREMSRAKMLLAFKIESKFDAVAAPAPVQVKTETPERLAEMEEMKRKIARLEEMAAMKKRIAELEKQLPKAMSAAAGR
jgi:hypothetical protein